MAEPMIALIAALFGGVGLKIIETLLNKSHSKNDLQTQMRSELRRDVMSLKDELEDIDNSLDRWKKKYYALILSFNELVIIAKAGASVDEIDDLVTRVRKEGLL